MAENSTDKIEAALAHQDRQIQDLSDMVTRQWQEIDALKKYITGLQGKIESLEDTMRTGEGEPLSVTEQALRDKPPHY